MVYVTRLDESFLTPYKSLRTNWGPVGYVAYKRTYPRKMCECTDACNCRVEDWHETILRCAQAIAEHGAFTKDELETLYHYWFMLKCSGGGRHLWQLGTKAVKRIGADSLQNCWFVSCSSLRSWLFAMDQLMLGGGVGFSVQAEHIYKLPPVKFKPDIKRVVTFDCDYVVADNREGWVKLLDEVFKSFFETGNRLHYNVSCLRAKGLPIKTFGGTASGGEILVEGVNFIINVLRGAYNRQLTSVECLDIFNILGHIVVSGNVRRSAEIAIGDAHDARFLEAKQWQKIHVPNWRARSNNSIACSRIAELPEAFWENYNGEGEPCGLINLGAMRTYGRMADGMGYREDPFVEGCNPCGEISLESYESCVSGQTRIQTRFGCPKIKDVVGQTVEIWNGKEWSEVTPSITGRNRKLFKVTLTDGSELEVTANHGWSSKPVTAVKFRRTETSTLKNGDKIEPFIMPWDVKGKSFAVAYELGLFIGDGYLDNGRPMLAVCGTKNKLRKLGVSGRWYEPQDVIGHAEPVIRLSLVGVIETGLAVFLNDKYEGIHESVFEFDRPSILQFIAGWIDTDGTVTNKHTKAEGYRVYGAELKMRDLQILLRRIGITSTIRLFGEAGQETNLAKRNYALWYLQIPSYDCLDIPTRIKVAVSFGDRYKENPAHRSGREIDVEVKQKVVTIEEIPGLFDTYCFDEPKRHMGVFGNVLTYQCNLSELILPNLNRHEFFVAAELMTKVCKTISCIPHAQPETRAVVERNHRLGIGVTGFLQALDMHDEKLFEQVYRHIEKVDREYSKLMNVDESVKLTTVKPSGTLSLLPGVTPGVHAAFGKYFIRRIEFGTEDSLVEICRKNGYHVEPKLNFDGTRDLKSMVIEFPCETPEGTVLQDELTAIEQLEHQLWLQTHWADNSVSCTVQYWPEELPGIRRWLEAHYDKEVKTCSFLLRQNHGFKQMPFEEISKEEYTEMAKRVKPIEEGLTSEGTMSSQECAGGYCPVR